MATRFAGLALLLCLAPVGAQATSVDLFTVPGPPATPAGVDLTSEPRFELIDFADIQSVADQSLPPPGVPSGSVLELNQTKDGGQIVYYDQFQLTNATGFQFGFSFDLATLLRPAIITAQIFFDGTLNATIDPNDPPETTSDVARFRFLDGATPTGDDSFALTSGTTNITGGGTEIESRVAQTIHFRVSTPDTFVFQFLPSDEAGSIKQFDYIVAVSGQLAPIPVPATLPLMVLGLGGLAAFGRWRRSARRD